MDIKPFIDYLQLERQNSAHTVTAYRADVEAFFAFAKAEYDITDPEAVVYPVIRSWIVQLVETQGLSNRSVNRKIASLKEYFNFLLKIGEQEISPLAKHKALKTKKKVQVPFSGEEVDTALDLLSGDDFVTLRDRLILELFYGTGMRRSELINLKWENINLGQGTIKVLGKGNKERLIPLLSFLKSSLVKYEQKVKEKFPRGEFPFILLSNTGKKTYDSLIYRTVTGYFKQVSRKAKKSPHLLRHSFATHLLNGGADLNTVKELLGHTSLAATQVYTQVGVERLKSVYGESHPRSKNKD